MKALGLIIIFLCPITIGAYSSHKTKTALIQLRGMIDFMNYIKSRIEYFNTPINDIYTAYENNESSLSELVFNISVSGWTQALESTQKIYLPNDIIEKLDQFGSYLGKSNKNEQLAHCDYYISLLENEYQKLKEEAPQKTKISLALGLSCGLMLVILLI